VRWISIGDFQFSTAEKKAIQDVISSNRVTEHKRVFEFEKKFSSFLENKYTVLTNSGTSALILGLESLKKTRIKENTKVITTPLTYVATTNALELTGFKPVFVDVDPDTFVITPNTIKEKLENEDNIDEYSMILPVHLMGYPADMDEINKICDKNNLISFEDSAQAHGTEYKGKKCGSMSEASAFSFYIAHNIQVGEMGALSTNNLSLAKLARSLKANGRMCDCQICTRSKGTCPKGSQIEDPRFTHSYIGYNFKTTEFMAAIGLSQLNKIDDILKKRQNNVKILNEGLEEFEDVLKLPKYSDTISYLAYPLVIKDKRKITRDQLSKKLEKEGVETRPLFSCIPTQQPSYNRYKQEYKDLLPNAEFIGNNGFYVGCHQFLTKEDLDYIISKFREILR